LAKQLHEVQAEREELVIAEPVLNRLTEQDRAAAEATAAVAPASARVAGRTVRVPKPVGLGKSSLQLKGRIFTR